LAAVDGMLLFPSPLRQLTIGIDIYTIKLRRDGIPVMENESSLNRVQEDEFLILPLVAGA
jgi:hypothetical protein